MNVNIETVSSAKTLAKTLRTLLQEKAGIKLPVGASLEVVAGLVDTANWDTLHGILAKQPAPVPPVVLLKPDQELTLYLEAYAQSSWGAGPRWAKLVITQQFLDNVRATRQRAIESKATLSSYDWPDAWDDSCDVSLEHCEFVVTAQGLIWYQASVKHSDYSVESRGLQLEELEALIKEALSEGRSYVLFDENDVEGLKEALAQAGELHFCVDCGANHTPDAADPSDLCPACAEKDFQDQDHN